jgi:hypothetical protein
MDGVLAHIYQAGWKELKTGCVYTTRSRLACASLQRSWNCA